MATEVMPHTDQLCEGALLQVGMQRESPSTIVEVHVIQESSLYKGDVDQYPLISFEDNSEEAQTLTNGFPILV